MAMIARLGIGSLAVGLVMLLASNQGQAGSLRGRVLEAKTKSVAADCGAPVCGEPACGAAANDCCEPEIIYRHVGCHKACCGCEAPIKSVLVVKDPCSCDCASIPVCLPGCCTDMPEVCAHPGLFGRGVVTYDYCCGVRIKVVFRNCGDIVVTYYGA
jgi:hypothetical protein